jgi:hypothetical protein
VIEAFIAEAPKRESLRKKLFVDPARALRARKPKEVRRAKA